MENTFKYMKKVNDRDRAAWKAYDEARAKRPPMSMTNDVIETPEQSRESFLRGVEMCNFPSIGGM